MALTAKPQYLKLTTIFFLQSSLSLKKAPNYALLSALWNKLFYYLCQVFLIS